MDAQDSRDLIDYWNLRAVRRNARPIPIQWLDVLSPYCREYIEHCYRPLRGNPHGVMTHANVLFARSLTSAAIEQLYADYLRVDRDGANVRQDWYPQFGVRPHILPFVIRAPFSLQERKRSTYKLMMTEPKFGLTISIQISLRDMLPATLAGQTL